MDDAYLCELATTADILLGMENRFRPSEEVEMRFREYARDLAGIFGLPLARVVQDLADEGNPFWVRLAP